MNSKVSAKINKKNLVCNTFYPDDLAALQLAHRQMLSGVGKTDDPRLEDKLEFTESAIASLERRPVDSDHLERIMRMIKLAAQED